MIKGVIGGVRVENIEESLMQGIRDLDKLINELAQEKSMEKIFRVTGKLEFCFHKKY